MVGVLAVEGDRVEGRREPLGGHAVRDVVEAAVGPLGAAFTREHAGGVFALALEGEHARGKGELAGHVLGEQPAQHVAPVLVARQADLGHASVRQRLGVEVLLDHAFADGEAVLVGAVALAPGGPVGEQLAAIVVEGGLERVVAIDQIAKVLGLALDVGDGLDDLVGAPVDDLDGLLADIGTQQLDGAA